MKTGIVMAAGAALTVPVKKSGLSGYPSLTTKLDDILRYTE